MTDRIGLVLTGGGARAAYQVGVLKAIAELLPRRARNPFPVICGTSAGALNAATLAINAGSYRRGVRSLTNIWETFHLEQVYRTDPIGVARNSLRWLAGLLLSGLGINRLKRVSLLDNRPLAEMLDRMLPCEQIQRHIDADLLHAVSVTASAYGSGESVTFFQGAQGINPWRRARRTGMPARIGTAHLMASSAIPFLFPATRIDAEHYGDGSMRQIAPLSSALHLGATRLLVISSTNVEAEAGRLVASGSYPSLAQIAGHALNSIFLDSLEVDVERVQTVNRLVAAMSDEARRNTGLKEVELLIMQPSTSIDRIAGQFMAELPWTIRLLLRLIGATPNGGSTALVSFLLSEHRFCRVLIDLGYRDAMQRKDELRRFFRLDEAA